MNTAETLAAIISPNAVLLAAVFAGWHLLKMGGGLQLKAPPVPKKAAGTKAEAATAPVSKISATRGEAA